MVAMLINLAFPGSFTPFAQRPFKLCLNHFHPNPQRSLS